MSDCLWNISSNSIQWNMVFLYEINTNQTLKNVFYNCICPIKKSSFFFNTESKIAFIYFIIFLFCDKCTMYSTDLSTKEKCFIFLTASYNWWNRSATKLCNEKIPYTTLCMISVPFQPIKSPHPMIVSHTRLKIP